MIVLGLAIWLALIVVPAWNLPMLVFSALLVSFAVYGLMTQ